MDDVGTSVGIRLGRWFLCLGGTEDLLLEGLLHDQSASASEKDDGMIIEA